VGDQPATAVRVLVRELSVDHVSDRLEATVRMPVRTPRLAGRVLHLTHLIHVHERVQGGGADPGERAHHRKALALVAAGTGGDRSDRPLGVGRTWCTHSRQGERVCGDCRHFSPPYACDTGITGLRSVYSRSPRRPLLLLTSGPCRRSPTSHRPAARARPPADASALRSGAPATCASGS